MKGTLNPKPPTFDPLPSALSPKLRTLNPQPSTLNMFKRQVQSIDELLPRVIRDNGLETPLLQRRLIDAWDEVTGRIVASYTVEKFIRNQTLMVRISNPALRADLSMMRSQLVMRLNQSVGSMIITDVRFF